MKKLKITLYIFILLKSGSLFCQNFTEDFKAINNAYINGDISFNLRFDYYNDSKSAQPSYSYSGMVKLLGSLVYYKINGVEFSYDSVYTSMIDHSHKTIMVDTVRNKTNFHNRINYVDSLAKAYKKVEFKEINNQYAKYTIYSLVPGISHSEIIFDKSTKLIQKISIWFLDKKTGAKEGAIGNKLVITYSNINSKSLNTYDVFNVQKKVIIVNRKVKPQTAFKKYEIIINME